MTKKEILMTFDDAKMKTPCYLFDESECISRAQKVKRETEAWAGKICFAIKANPFLIPSLLPVVDKFEVCSPGELEICRKYHIPGEKILFSGVVKTKENIEKALEYPVDVITLESLTHWELLKEILSDKNKKADCQCDEKRRNHIVKIMPRLSNGAQFGMEESQLFQIIEEQKSIENIVVEGIHYFTGTQKKGNKYEEELEAVAEIMKKLKENHGLNDLILEYGPGFAVPYFINDDFSEPLELIIQMKAYIMERMFPFRIDIELGRYLAASCGRYLTSIVDIKSVGKRNYCLVDGGIHHVNYYGSNMAMRTPIIKHIKGNGGNLFNEGTNETNEYMVCGSLCTFADILVRGLPLNSPAIGDLLIFENIGAYSITEGSYLFLSRDLPGVYLKECGGNIRELRPHIPSYEINCFN